MFETCEFATMACLAWLSYKEAGASYLLYRQSPRLFFSAFGRFFHLVFLPYHHLDSRGVEHLSCHLLYPSAWLAILDCLIQTSFDSLIPNRTVSAKPHLGTLAPSSYQLPAQNESFHATTSVVLCSSSESSPRPNVAQVKRRSDYRFLFAPGIRCVCRPL